MIQSMTGYGYNESINESYSASLEIKGYNNRYLDIQLSLPKTLGLLEEDLRRLIKQYCKRGRLEMYLRIQDRKSGVDSNIDFEKAQALRDRLQTIKKKLGISGRIQLDHLLEFKDFIMLETNFEIEVLSPLLQEVFEGALCAVVESRSREGAEMLNDILSQLDRIQAGLREIQTRAPDIEKYINARLRSRFEDLLGDQVGEERVLTEIASLLVRHSINEEMSRLEAHIGQFIREIHSPKAVGKRLDFICQEINREINTIAAKNLLSELPSQIIEMKDALENIREQLRNIE